MNELHDALTRLYSLPDCCSGGPLHITTDDLNVEDADLDFCVIQVSMERSVEVKKAATLTLGLLQAIPPHRRRAAIKEWWASR